MRSYHDPAHTGRDPDDEFLILVLRYLDGALAEEQEQDLVDRLRASDTLRQRFVTICYQDQLSTEVSSAALVDLEAVEDDLSEGGVSASVMRELLSQERDTRLLALAALAERERLEVAQAQAKQASQPEPTADLRGPRTIVIPRWAFIGGIAAMLMLAAGLIHMSNSSTPKGLTTVDRPALPTEPGKPPVVAKLIRERQAVWHDQAGNPTTKAYDQIREGDELTLVKGLIELEMGNGAIVIVQAPAALRFESNRTLRLLEGRLSASVAERGKGFEVLTRQTRIVDLGTEFGVAVDAAGDTRVEVFEGLVTLALSGEESGPAPMNLTVGMGAAVDARGLVRTVKAQPLAYVRPDEFDTLIKADAGSAYHRWIASTYRWRRDPSVLAYYLFDQQDQQADRLTNRADGVLVAHDGRLGDADQIAAPTWVPGRFAQTHALAFGLDERGKVRGVVVPDSDALDLIGPMTLALWVRQTQDRDVWNTLLSKRELPPFRLNYQFSISYDQTTQTCDLQFGAGEDEPSFAAFYQVHDRPSPDLRQWTHVAMTADGQTLRFYLNGKQVHTADQPDASMANDVPLLIGTAAPQLQPPFQGGLRPLHGEISELLIARRAFTDQEIRELSEAGNPEGQAP